MENKRYDRALVWFRRDLRAHDHAALYHALKASRAVHCVFVFDSEILDALPSRRDRRVEFIWESVVELRATLEQLGGALLVLHGRARDEIPRLARLLRAQAVYANHDYEPAALERDRAVQRALLEQGIGLHSFKDQVIFEKDEVLTRRRPALQRIHRVQERLAAASWPLLRQTLSSRKVRRYAGASARREHGKPRGARLRADQSEGAAPAHRYVRRQGLVAGFSISHRSLPGTARLPGAKGAFVPVCSPALRDCLDP